jgi:hypothetical protein
MSQIVIGAESVMVDGDVWLGRHLIFFGRLEFYDLMSLFSWHVFSLYALFFFFSLEGNVVTKGSDILSTTKHS